jgi:hypothetical protein
MEWQIIGAGVPVILVGLLVQINGTMGQAPFDPLTGHC